MRSIFCSDLIVDIGSPFEGRIPKTPKQGFLVSCVHESGHTSTYRTHITGHIEHLLLPYSYFNLIPSRFRERKGILCCL